MSVNLTAYKVVSVRCRCYNTAEQLVFVRGTNSESYLTYYDGSTLYRGGYLIDWTNNLLKVRWTAGAGANIYAESVRGIL